MEPVAFSALLLLRPLVSPPCAADTNFLRASSRGERFKLVPFSLSPFPFSFIVEKLISTACIFVIWGRDGDLGVSEKILCCTPRYIAYFPKATPGENGTLS